MENVAPPQDLPYTPSNALLQKIEEYQIDVGAGAAVTAMPPEGAPNNASSDLRLAIVRKFGRYVEGTVTPYNTVVTTAPSTSVPSGATDIVIPSNADVRVGDRVSLYATGDITPDLADGADDGDVLSARVRAIAHDDDAGTTTLRLESRRLISYGFLDDSYTTYETPGEIGVSKWLYVGSLDRIIDEEGDVLHDAGHNYFVVNDVVLGELVSAERVSALDDPQPIFALNIDPISGGPGATSHQYHKGAPAGIVRDLNIHSGSGTAVLRVDAPQVVPIGTFSYINDVKGPIDLRQPTATIQSTNGQASLTIVLSTDTAAGTEGDGYEWDLLIGQDADAITFTVDTVTIKLSAATPTMTQVRSAVNTLLDSDDSIILSIGSVEGTATATITANTGGQFSGGVDEAPGENELSVPSTLALHVGDTFTGGPAPDGESATVTRISHSLNQELTYATFSPVAAADVEAGTIEVSRRARATELTRGTIYDSITGRLPGVPGTPATALISVGDGSELLFSVSDTSTTTEKLNNSQIAITLGGSGSSASFVRTSGTVANSYNFAIPQNSRVEQYTIP